MSLSPRHLAAHAEAVELARRLLDETRGAVLSVLDARGWPMTSRIALQTDAAGVPLACLSALALHTGALRRDGRAALLIDGDIGAKGTPLNRARLSLQVRAEAAADSESDALRNRWRERDPKAAVYLGLPDFSFWRLHVVGGLLNAGFGRASLIREGDL